MSINAFTENLQRDAAASGLFDGLFLGGSHGRGSADFWSDIDLVGLAPAGRHEAITDWWRNWLEQGEPLLYFKVLPRGGTLINAIDQRWLRIDLNLVEAAQIRGRAKDQLVPLVDPAGLYAGLAESLPDHRADPRRIEELVWEFIRVLGLTAVGLGRKEWVVMVMGTGLLRDMLSQIMQEALPLPDRGGMLHLSKILPEGEMQVLLDLPYPGPEKEALISAQLAIAQAFFPRARRLAAAVGAEWPTRFETATRDMLARTIGREPDTLWPRAEHEMNASI